MNQSFFSPSPPQTTTKKNKKPSKTGQSAGFHQHFLLGSKSPTQQKRRHANRDEQKTTRHPSVPGSLKCMRYSKVPGSPTFHSAGRKKTVLVYREVCEVLREVYHQLPSPIPGLVNDRHSWLEYPHF